eukprot:scaffold1822_cov333-Pavlova_lutheri.AAC.8
MPLDARWTKLAPIDRDVNSKESRVEQYRMRMVEDWTKVVPKKRQCTNERRGFTYRAEERCADAYRTLGRRRSLTPR